MRKLNCIQGDKFGDWTVIDNTPISKWGHIYIKVQCKCGKIEEKCLSDLVAGRTKSCKSCGARRRGLNIKVGDKYKHWTVIEGPLYDKGYVKYKTQCDCGNTRLFLANELVNPNKCFQCSKCAGIDRGKQLSIENGRVGDLTATKYGKLKKSAMIRDIEFSVTIEYLWNLFILQNQICAITGDYISSINKASLDRINSSKGYIEGNVQWVTYQANVSKHTMTMEQLYEFCNKVINHANQQLSHRSAQEYVESSTTNP